MREKLVGLCCLLLLAGVALAQGEPEQEILKAERAFNAATQARRAAGWMEFMADNVVVLLPSDQPVVGREAVQKFYEGAFSNPDFQLTWEPTHAEVIGGGDLAYAVGRYKLSTKTKEGKEIHRTGSYLTTWAKQKDGSWKVISDVGSPDAPPKK